MIDKLLIEYANKFNENFPIRIVRLNDKELEETLQKCLKTGKPYELDKEMKKNVNDNNITF